MSRINELNEPLKGSLKGPLRAYHPVSSDSLVFVGDSWTTEAIGACLYQCFAAQCSVRSIHADCYLKQGDRPLNGLYKRSYKKE